MLKRTVVVFLCTICCVKSDGEYVFEKPTPVLRNPPKIQSTDVLNPLKHNGEPDLKLLTTSNVPAVLLNPTPVSEQLQTTEVAKPMIDNEIISKQFSTTNALPYSDSSVNPTPVLNTQRQETAAANPILLNLPPVAPQSTGAVGNHLVEPTPVIISIATKPVAIALVNDEPQPLSISNPAYNPIQPSQVYLNDAVGTTTEIYTPNLNQQQVQNKVGLTMTADNEIGPCTCKNYEDLSTATQPALQPASHGTGIPLPLQFYIPAAPGYAYDRHDMTRPPSSIYQNIAFQLNLFFNNIPVFTANVDPKFYFNKNY